MLTTVEIVEAIVITTIMVRQRITDKVMTTDVTIETIIIVRKNIIVFTGVYFVTHLDIETDHIDTGTMVAGNKKTIL
ncbi:MAG: hypothetical protein GQ468_01695 [Candidatus Scalindua sp.]|jgi:hypothetical protein|nr:hypothetical protein [Candidatus Scalindua sp.]